MNHRTRTFLAELAELMERHDAALHVPGEIGIPFAILLRSGGLHDEYEHESFPIGEGSWQEIRDLLQSDTVKLESCDGCVYRHWVAAAYYGTSSSGWGCLRSGGHAMKRCGNFKTEQE